MCGGEEEEEEEEEEDTGTTLEEGGSARAWPMGHAFFTYHLLFCISAFFFFCSASARAWPMGHAEMQNNKW